MSPWFARLTPYAVLALTLSACATGQTSSSARSTAHAGSIAATSDLTGVTITVGSKEFTEQKILGRILSKTLSASGAKVVDQTGLSGSTARTALEAGKIDVYYEYTGTAWIDALKQTKPVAGEQAQFDAVKEADVKNGIIWLAPAPANNTYAIAANQQIAKKYSPKTISDYAGVARQDPHAAALCTEAEFVNRDDGLPGLKKAYGFPLPAPLVAQLDYGLVYASVAKGDPCNFAVVFATDGQIQANHLTVLQDDKDYFPLYNIAISMRDSVYKAHKDAYDKLFGQLDKLLTNEQMRQLNAAVDVDGQPLDKVADDFLIQHNVV